MFSKVCFLSVVFYVVAMLVAVVYLRHANNLNFYQLRTHQVELDQLKQQLWQYQLQVETLVAPTKVLEPDANDSKL